MSCLKFSAQLSLCMDSAINWSVLNTHYVCNRRSLGLLQLLCLRTWTITSLTLSMTLCNRFTTFWSRWRSRSRLKITTRTMAKSISQKPCFCRRRIKSIVNYINRKKWQCGAGYCKSSSCEWSNFLSSNGLIFLKKFKKMFFLAY